MIAPIVVCLLFVARWQAKTDGGMTGFYGVDLWIADVDRDFFVDDTEAAQAIKMARLHPLDGRIDRVLYSYALTKGDMSAADRWLQRAEKRAPRDVLARSALAAQALQREDWPAASEHYDAFLRLWPQQSDIVFEMVSQRLSLPAMQSAWLQRLSYGPVWRPRFSRWLVKAPLSLNDKQALFDAMEADGHAAESELDDRLAMLQAEGLEQDAKSRWSAHVGLTEAAEFAISPIAEPIEAISGRPRLLNGYGWRVGTAEGINVSLPSSKGEELRVAFTGRAITRPLLMQRLALESGRYLITAHVYSTSEIRVQWVVQCVNANARASNVADNGARTEVVVPDSCPGQILTLQLRGRSQAERQPHGELTLNSIALVPLTNGS